MGLSSRDDIVKRYDGKDRRSVNHQFSLVYFNLVRSTSHSSQRIQFPGPGSGPNRNFTKFRGDRHGVFQLSFCIRNGQHDGLDPIYSLLGIDDGAAVPMVSDIDTPFIHIERGPGGHARYGDCTETTIEYFQANGSISTEALCRDYGRSIELTAGLFEDRLEDLDRRELREDKLVIYTFDHGEQLGESGMVGHNSPMRPETAYVPTVFIHPDLPDARVTGGVTRHVDLLPTVCSLINVGDSHTWDGVALSDQKELPRYGTTVYRSEFLFNPLPIGTGTLSYEGVWEENGGDVFSRSNSYAQTGGKALQKPETALLQKTRIATPPSIYQRERHVR